MKTKITLNKLNIKVQILMREIRDLRNIMFKWGRQNMKDIDEIKKTTPRKKRNEELSEQVNQERFEERNNEIKQEKAELKNE